MAQSELALASLKQNFVMPDFLKTVNLKYVKLGYHYLIQHAMYLLLLPLCMAVAAEVARLRHVGMRAVWDMLQYNLVNVMLFSTTLVFVITIYFMTRPYPVYMVDFSCYKASEKDMCSNADFMRCSYAMGAFNEKSLDFQRKICERSGLGEETYLPPAVISEPPNPCMAEARLEAERVMFGALNELFAKTCVKPKDVGILIVNCSLFVPTPSLSAIIVNHYNMRGNIRSVNLGGMGCSAGVISIDLAKHLLQVHRNTTALVVSMENITLNWYWGNDKSKLVSNCIFRMGGAAILLSNCGSMKKNSKYELVHSVRTHKGADDKAFSCVFQEEDCDMNIGVSLSKELMTIAGNALKVNITTLGPMVLPLSEQILFFASLLLRRLGKVKLKPYIPDFKLAFEHFCIHAGGRAVLDEIEKNLSLSEWHMEPSRMTLFRFGNTSSSSLWYELAYTEAKGRVKKGDRVWQIAFGSGFKCNSAVWRSLRAVKPRDCPNVWSSFVDKFPVKVPRMRKFP
ncbi:hypothetical protein L7F22_045862 [Adiantum nelumboides]|nr:hypothetical protein [Adiantum nelumboides]